MVAENVKCYGVVLVINDPFLQTMADTREMTLKSTVLHEWVNARSTVAQDGGRPAGRTNIWGRCQTLSGTHTALCIRQRGGTMAPQPGVLTHVSERSTRK